MVFISFIGGLILALTASAEYLEPLERTSSGPVTELTFKI